ncbi:MAG TPA: hypothetical protein VIN11_02380, partial [Roseivirga sp.]
TEEGLTALNGSKPLYTAFYLADKNNEELKGAIEQVQQTDANGMAFYDYGLLNDEFREIIIQQKTTP